APAPPAPRGPAGRAAWSAAGAAVLALGASLALAACEGGAIGQSTAASNGQSFVSGSAGTTVYGATSGPAAPRVTGTLLSGSKFALAQYRGQVVVLNFWGSWCTPVPCRGAAPGPAGPALHPPRRPVPRRGHQGQPGHRQGVPEPLRHQLPQPERPRRRDRAGLP